MRGGIKQRNRARRLRADPTEAEKRLWLSLRPLRRSHALHVRRQMPLGPHIVDFAIVSRKLVIEVDGGQHGDMTDTARDAWMTAQGYRVLRFWNNEVFDNLEGVMETIFLACGSPHPRPLSVDREGSRTEPADFASLPASGEGPRVGNTPKSRRNTP